MLITTKIVWDIETWAVLERDAFQWDGPVALAKGDPTAQAEEESQANFTNTLNSIFQQQYSTQSSQLQYLQQQLEPEISNPTGYTPTQLTSLQTSATDTNAQQFENAESALNNQISQNAGGSKLAGVAGATVEADAQLQNAEAQTQAASQEQISQQNAQLQQQNYWNAVNALNGVAAQENPLGYAGASTSSANSVAGLSQAVTASNQSQLLGALGGVVGGVGSALGGIAKNGGFGALMCWVAASFFSWHDLRTFVVRMWMLHEAPVWFRTLYIKHGEWISKTPIRWAFRPLFEYVLLRAA